MKLLSIFLSAGLSLTLLSGCETNPPIKGMDTTKKLEIDERLLVKPKSFQKVDPSAPFSEFFILTEYSDLAKAYVSCYNNSVGLIKLLEGSNLVLKVPSTATFMADPSTKPQD